MEQQAQQVQQVQQAQQALPPKLPLKVRLCYSVGHAQNDVAASLWFTYILLFFTKVLQWSSSYAGYIMLIGQVADALATPIIGLLADKKLGHKYWLCRYGRRKIWHLLGTVCVVITCPFIFSPCVVCSGSGVNYPVQLAYYAVFVCIFQVGWAAVQVSHLSLIPDLTPSTNERTGLIASRYTFTVISNILVFCSAWVFLRSSSENDENVGPKDAASFQYAMAVGLGVGIFCSLAFHVGVTEKDSGPGSRVSADGGPTPTAAGKASVKDLLTSLRTYQVAGVYMASRLFANLTQVYTPLYLQDLNLGAQSVAIVPLVMFISGFTTSLVVKQQNKYLGRQGAYAVGSFVGLGGCLWVFFGDGDTYTTYEIYAVAVLLGASSTIQVVTSLGLTADLIGTKTDSGAFVYGAMSFTDKLSNGIAVAILQNYLDKNSKQVLSFVCGGASILGLLFMATLVFQASTKQSAVSSVERGIQTEENHKSIIAK